MPLPFLRRNIANIALALAAGGNAFALTLEDYKNINAPCFDRSTNSSLTVADTHIHFRPFGGPAVSFEKLRDEVHANGVLFAGVMGIGQRLPNGALNDGGNDCESYRDCPGQTASPSTKNDWVNAANFYEFKSPGMEMIYSMTFPDLSNTSNVLNTIRLYDKEYPGLFKVMGESNVVKQALFPNHHQPVTVEEIDRWADSMPELRARGIPFFLHSDLGSDAEPLKYLPLIQHVLAKYPDNKIVWLHLGISGELTSLDPAMHISTLSSLLDTHPNLYVDTSWRVIEDNYFSKHRDAYVQFINKYSHRIITGSDYVAYKNKAPAYNYTDELRASSEMNKYISNDAFRNIALGQTYLAMLGMTGKYNAPKVCTAPTPAR